MKGLTDWDSDLRVSELDNFWKYGNIDYRKQIVSLIVNIVGNTNLDSMILDCGCGTGLLLDLLPDNLKENYMGIDFTPSMIRYCKRTYPEYKDSFEVVDILNYDDIPESDIIVTQNVIQHITLYQIAIYNLVCKTRKALILNERTKVGGISHPKPSFKRRLSMMLGLNRNNPNTEVFGYNPTRWRFREEDVLEVMGYVGKLRSFYKPVVYGYPSNTEGLKGVLAIYVMYHHDF